MRAKGLSEIKIMGVSRCSFPVIKHVLSLNSLALSGGIQLVFEYTYVPYLHVTICVCGMYLMCHDSQ